LTGLCGKDLARPREFSEISGQARRELWQSRPDPQGPRFKAFHADLETITPDRFPLCGNPWAILPKARPNHSRITEISRP
jgi:hypothetical protein